MPLLRVQYGYSILHRFYNSKVTDLNFLLYDIDVNEKAGKENGGK